MKNTLIAVHPLPGAALASSDRHGDLVTFGVIAGVEVDQFAQVFVPKTQLLICLPEDFDQSFHFDTCDLEILHFKDGNFFKVAFKASSKTRALALLERLQKVISALPETGIPIPHEPEDEDE